jgi:hypothetical protein
MKANAYEVLLQLLASLITGGGSFLVGLGLGWVFWKQLLRFKSPRAFRPGGAG